MSFYKITMTEYVSETTEPRTLACITVHDVDLAKIFEDRLWGLITDRLKAITQDVLLSPPPEQPEVDGDAGRGDG